MTYVFGGVYMLFWIILCGKVNFQIIIIGTVVCGTIEWINLSQGWREKLLKKIYFKKVIYLIVYVLVLMKEIIIANFNVAGIILNPKLNISPCMITFTTRLKTNFYRTILANSITLTPGTLTVIMDQDKVVVHCLKEDYINEVINSKFEKILLKVEAYI